MPRNPHALDAEGGRDVTIVITMNSDRLQVHREWEMSGQRNHKMQWRSLGSIYAATLGSYPSRVMP